MRNVRKYNEIIDYKLEILNTAREELFMRVKKRDDWLKLHLLSQATLFALSKGIKLGSIEASKNTPDLLHLSILISFIFVVLYIIEERLVGNISKVIKTLYLKLPKVKIMSMGYKNNNNRNKYHISFIITLILRLIAQTIAFLIIPGYFSLYSYFPIKDLNLFCESNIIFLLFLPSVFIAITLISSFSNRIKFEDIYEFILKSE